MDVESDEHYMDLALMEAKKAELAGEVPVGAVIVSGNAVIGREGIAARTHAGQQQRREWLRAHASQLASLAPRSIRALAWASRTA